MERSIRGDIIVLGGGGAGFCAAMRADQLGSRVILLEKAPSVGGSAAMARGVGAVGARDQMNSPKGAFTTAQMLQDWMEQTNYMANFALIHEYLRHSGETVDWLQDLGCKLDYVGTVQPKHEQSPFQTYFIWDTYKAGEMRRLIRRVEEGGGQILLRTAAEELIVENGRVTGVWARDEQGRFPVYGKAVIACTGGYGANEEMVLRATRGVKVNAINTGFQTGDGIRMAMDIGCDTENLDAIELHGCDAPCDKLSRASIGRHGNELSRLTGFPGVLWLNRFGQRFVNEGVWEDISYTGNAAFRQGSDYYILLDRAMADALTEKGTRPLGLETDLRGLDPDTPWPQLFDQLREGLACGAVHKADSLSDLAESVGMDGAALSRTVAEYNAACAAGHDDMYGKDAAYLHAYGAGPYYLVEGRANQLCSLGGLRINTAMQALRPDGRPIPGLYAAGCDASGGLVNNAYVSYEGVTLGWACTSGKLAAEHAADHIEKEHTP